MLAIGERVGHEAEKITYRYAHLFPTVQTEMAEKVGNGANGKGGQQWKEVLIIKGVGETIL